MSALPEVQARTEIRDGMRITWHQPIRMEDGLVLRADVSRPVEDVRCPVILTYGIYAKGLAYQEGYPLQWEKMVGDYPEILRGSTGKYQNWETTDPERWVPHGYAIVRVDSRVRYSSPRPVFLSKGAIRPRDKPSGRSDSSVWTVPASVTPWRTSAPHCARWCSVRCPSLGCGARLGPPLS